MASNTYLAFLGVALAALLAPTAASQEVLPFPPTPSASTAGLTMQDSTYKKRVEPKRLADGAPNILIILMDDVGPGTPSTYGGEIRTPTLDRVAKMGISYNRFHSTAMCSPTRGALLTGRNHTRIGNGQISAIANDFDGFSGIIPKSSATVAEVLKNYGYNTAAFGKWHNTPEEQITSKGPLDYWPTGKVKVEVESKLAAKIGGPMDVTLKVNGTAVAQGQVPAAMSLHFTSNATFDIGTDLDSPVSLDYFDWAVYLQRQHRQDEDHVSEEIGDPHENKPHPHHNSLVTRLGHTIRPRSISTQPLRAHRRKPGARHPAPGAG
jgi:arylsulfatase A-like enzyme